MTESSRLEKVDIEKVFSNKNPGLAKMIPGFVFRYLKRIIHQDFINDFLERHGDKFGVDFANAAIEEYKVQMVVKGEENVPKNGRYIFVSNHPLGGFDGIIFMHLMAKMGFSYKVLVNDILMNIKNLHPLLLPINKHGGHPKEIVQKIEEAFNSDIQIITFPSGMVSRRIKGKIIDLPWQKNFILKALQYKRDIVPVHFSGRNSNFFYNLHSIRTFLGIKANLEMFYLMDETQKHRNTTITVSFGKPVSYHILDKHKKQVEWASEMMDHVYRIAEDPNIEFQP